MVRGASVNYHIALLGIRADTIGGFSSSSFLLNQDTDFFIRQRVYPCRSEYLCSDVDLILKCEEMVSASGLYYNLSEGELAVALRACLVATH